MFTNTFKLAGQSFSRNKLRTILTAAGIIIGIMAVVVVMSTGQAIEGFIMDQLQMFGTDYIEIEVKTPQTEHTSMENVSSMAGGAMITTLKISDAEAVAKHPNIRAYYAGVLGQELITYQNESKKIFLFGVSSMFPEIDRGELEQGRFFTAEEDAGLAKVAVLGKKVSDKLFPQNDALGKKVKIGRENYKVIGLMKERGATFGFDMDDMAFLPVQTVQKTILGIDYVSFIFAQMHDTSRHAETAEDVRLIMRDRHDTTNLKDDDFAVVTMQEAQEMLGTIILGVQILLIVLASISLIVGGIGIMNIMYVSVTERTFEIGLRKAVGARSTDIMRQFLVEAVIITFLGAVIGLTLGILAAFAISLAASAQGFDWQFSISTNGIILACAMSIAVGVIFGLYPAKKAAKLEPIEALRREG